MISPELKQRIIENYRAYLQDNLPQDITILRVVKSFGQDRGLTHEQLIPYALAFHAIITEYHDGLLAELDFPAGEETVE